MNCAASKAVVLLNRYSGMSKGVVIRSALDTPPSAAQANIPMSALCITNASQFAALAYPVP